MAKRSGLKCAKCKRSFSMAAHLARHMSAMHGVKSPRAKARAARGRGMYVRRGKRGGRRGGRKPAAVASLQLGSMSLDQLILVIDAAKQEAKDRLDKLQLALN